MIFKNPAKTKKVSRKNIKHKKSEGDQFYLLPYREKPVKPHKLLKSLHAKNNRYSWEYYKKKDGSQYIRFWSQEGKKQVINSILTNFEEAQIETGGNDFLEINNRLIGAALNLRSPDFYPLRMKSTSEKEEKERLGRHVLSALRDTEGEYLFQILFKPIDDFNFPKYSTREAVKLPGPSKKIERLREKENSPTAQELASDIGEKMRDPSCFRTQIRFIGTCGSKSEILNGFHNVSSALSQFRHRTDRGNKASLKLIDPEKLEQFLSYMKKRKFWDGRTIFQRIIPLIKKNPYPRYLSSKELRWFLEIPIYDLDGMRVKDASMKEHPISARRKEKVGKSNDGATFGKTQREEEAKVTDFDRHVYVTGKTGMGKSTVLQHLALNRIEKKKNTIVIDPHGDLVTDILERLKPERLKDVIYISPSSPIGFNALDIPDFPKGEKKKLDEIGRRQLKEARLTADEKQIRALSSMIKDHFGREFWGPRLSSIFSWFTKGLLDEKGSNFVDFYHILNDRDTAQKFSEDTSIQEVEHYIQTFFEKLDERDKHSTLNKIGKIRRSRVLRKMLCIREPDLEISELIEPGKIVLINLSKGLQDKDKAHFVGSALSNLIWSCIGHRQLLDKKDRGETYLFADEFQNFATEVFTDMLSEGRKYGLRLVLANQYTSQLDQNIWDAIEGNIGTTISFTSSNQDAEMLSHNYGDKVEQHEFVNLRPFNALVNYGESEVNRVKTLPPKPPKTKNALEKVLQNMERLSPNIEMKLQRANTPRWEKEEADTWDILIGIYRKQIEQYAPPSISEVKKEEPRNNLIPRLQKMDANNLLDYDPTTDEDTKVSLNENSIEKLLELIGSSNKAGKKAHKEMILKVWETLETNGLRTHIVRQDQRGILPDLTIEYCDRADLRWGGSDIEVEKSTKTKPAKILKNLANGENKDRKILFFTYNIEGAERIYDIIRDPYTADGQCYKDTKGRKFDPTEEFTTNYWERSLNDTNIDDLCEIFILDKGVVQKYRAGKTPKVIISHHKVVNGEDYLFDKVREYNQDSISGGKDDEGIREEDEAPKTEEKDEKIAVLRGEDGDKVPWLKEDDDESVTISDFVKQFIDDRKKENRSNLEETKKQKPLIHRMADLEYKCAKLESTREQPNEMELQLENIPHPQRYLVFTVEGMYAYSKYQKHGYYIPQKPVSIKQIIDCLEDRGKAKLPERSQSLGKKFSNFLNSMGIKSEFKETRNRSYYDLASKSELLKSLYKFKIVKTLGESYYTYPMLYKASQKSLGRHTAYKLFDHSAMKHNKLKIDIFEIELDLECQLLSTIAQLKKEELSLNKISDSMDIEKDEAENILREWDIDLDDEQGLRELNQSIRQILAPFIE